MSTIQHAQYISLTGSYDSFSTAELIDVLKYADDAYFNTDIPALSDVHYDSIKQYLLYMCSAALQQSYLQSVGSAVRGGKITLPSPMPSLNQVYQGDIQEWVKKYKLEKKAIVISDKLDGASGLVCYKQTQLNIGYSRGDGIQGADITRHLTKILSIPKTITSINDLDVRGETIISKQNFEQLRVLAEKHQTRQYANARNMVAGLMNSKENPSWMYDHISFLPYEIIDAVHLDKMEQLQLLHSYGFAIPWHIVVFGNELTDEFLTNTLNHRRNVSPFVIDGIVIDINNAEKRWEVAESKTKNPTYAVKYKVLSVDDLVEATVLSVEWNVSKHGYLKPKVIITPVQLFGTTVRQATAFNAAFIERNNIGPGTKIMITKSGMVIPFIHSIVSSTFADLPNDIEYHWNDTHVDIIVSNPDAFKDIVVNQLIAFFTSIKVPALKEGNVKKLVAAGITSPEAIINLSMDAMSEILGSDIIGEKVYIGIISRLIDIPFFTLMGAYSTNRGIGERKIKPLYQYYVDRGGILGITTQEEITVVKGYDVKTAEKILLEIDRFKLFLSQVQEKCTIQKSIVVESGPLTNEHIVFTGFRDAKLEQKLESLGAIIQSAVNKKTTLLVTADINDSSSKIKKAKELNVTIVEGAIGCTTHFNI
jgi:NAD-dependent DNA ligase